MSKAEKLTFLHELLAFFCQESDWDSFELLFEHTADFLESSLGAYNIFYFSNPHTEGKKSKDLKLRYLYGRPEEKREKVQKDFAPLFDVIREDDESWFVKHEDKRNLYSFQLGVFKGQNYRLYFEKDDALTESKEVLELFSKYLSKAHRQIVKLNQLVEMNSLVYIDDVTGLYNQRKLLADLDLLIERGEIFNRSFTVFFIDIDYFKKVNDSHGHLVGTKLLEEFANILRKLFRESDLVYRYGGDEFVMVVPHIDFQTATKMGNRILEHVKNHPFTPEDDLNVNLSVSVGIAEYPTDAKTKKEILHIADQMMYKAKKAGRGRVCSAHEMLADD